MSTKRETLKALAIAAGVVTLLGFSAMTAAEARDRYGNRPGYVVAESNWGNGVVTGLVRRGPRFGWQVRLPRGTWIDCVRSCSETLRRATVDFWPSQGGPRAKDSGPGYFRWEWWW
jgi:hypothetical protein